MVDDPDDDIDDVDEGEDVELMSDDDEENDNVGDLSVEINVDELVAKIEGRDHDDVKRRREIRRRLEEIREQREAERELDNTFNFNLDDDF
jgi:hypothetical protein